MIVNPGKFKAVIFDKRKGNHTNHIINIDQKEIKSVLKVKLIRKEIDDKLNFNHHINTICKSASNKLDALRKLKYLQIQKTNDYNGYMNDIFIIRNIDILIR